MNAMVSPWAAYRILRLNHVMQATGYARSSIWRQIKAGLLPQPIKLGRRAIGWSAAEIAAINAARIAGHDEQRISALVKHLHQQRSYLSAAFDNSIAEGEAP